jgi:hypothetical protein
LFERFGHCQFSADNGPDALEAKMMMTRHFSLDQMRNQTRGETRKGAHQYIIADKVRQGKEGANTSVKGSKMRQ